MQFKQRKLPLVIKKSNELTRTELSVENNALANKIFATLIRNLEEKIYPQVSFPVTELLDKEIKGGDKYKSVKKAAAVLMKARIDSLEYDSSGKEIGFNMFNLFESCHYKNGMIKANFSLSLKPHLLGLKQHFTSLNYFDLMELSSFYSQRIYELLKSWEMPKGFVDIKLSALYDFISFPVPMRNNFKNVRQKVLEQAEKEINGKTELQFRWEPIKEGRKVVAVRFIIGEQGKRTQKKREIQEAEKENRKVWDEATRRKPHLEAAQKCRKEHGIKSGDICKIAKPRTQKCKLCKKTAEVNFYASDSLFDV